MRIPEAMNGFSGSKGMAFFIHRYAGVIQRFFGHLAGNVFGAQIHEKHVAIGSPVTMRKPRVVSSRARALAFFRTCSWYFLTKA